MNSSETPTPLESLFLNEAYHQYKLYGFPNPSEIRVEKRVQDTGGRYSYLKHSGTTWIPTGLIVVGQAILVATDMLILGEIKIEGGIVLNLHMIVTGNHPWDGEEPEPFELYTH